MRSYVFPVLVRTVGLAAVSLTFWILVDLIGPVDEDLTYLLAFIAVLAGIAGVWAAVDGLRSARREDPVRTGLVVWVVVAVATGLLQPVLVIVAELLAGLPASQPGLDGVLRVAFFYALVVALPATPAFAVFWFAARRFHLRARQ